jgi:hypothetical protein
MDSPLRVRLHAGADGTCHAGAADSAVPVYYARKVLLVTAIDRAAGARPIFHHKRESIEAHLTVVFAALAVSRHRQDVTGTSISKLRPLIVAGFGTIVAAGVRGERVWCRAQRQRLSGGRSGRG